MSFIEYLKEALSREQVADLARNVAVVGPEGKFLNLMAGRKGVVMWMNEPRFDLKGKILRDVIPNVQDEIGEYEIVDRDEIESDWGTGPAASAISTEEPVSIAQ